MTVSQKSTAYSIHKHWLRDCFTKSTTYSIHKHWLCDCFTKITCMFNSLTAGLIHKNQLYAWFMSTDYVTDSQKSTVCSIHKCWLQDWFTKINFMLDSILTAWLIHKNQLRAQFTSTDGRTDSLKSTVCQILQRWLYHCVLSLQATGILPLASPGWTSCPRSTPRPAWPAPASEFPW